jgi:16S rRNA (adenine1518-N6/adenine1519-N6)-dimethyltransferase
VRSLASELAAAAHKTLGQNFVIDPNTVRRLVRTAGVDAGDVVVEVGPGLGRSPSACSRSASRSVAVEIDPVLPGGCRRPSADRLPACADRLEVVLQDALDLDSVPGPPPTAFVANLPYNVAVPVLLRLLEHLPSPADRPGDGAGEVPTGWCAPPGSRTYGIPSVKAAWYADVRRAGSIGRTVFWPAPHVDSGLVAFTRREPPVGDRLATFAVVDAAFAQRRKTLRAALAGWAGSAAAAEQRLRAAGIDPGARGEVLGVEDFARLAATPVG